MTTNKKRAVNPNDKIGSQEVTDADNDLLADIYRGIDDLYKMRLIEKIARPIDVRSRENYAEGFLQMLDATHSKLTRFRINLIEKIAFQDGKEKSMEEEQTNRNMGLKKKLRAIESKYNEVFFEGSFKHYQKIKETFNLSTDIQPIQIVDWTNDCIQRLAGGGGNCC